VNPKVFSALNSISDMEFPRHSPWWPIVPARTTALLSLLIGPTLLPDTGPACLLVPLLASPSPFAVVTGPPPPRHLRNNRKSGT
jgi:hypothetical protein